MLAQSELSALSTVGEALAYLDASGYDAALVGLDGRPVGVITRDALRGGGGLRPRPDALVTDVMDLELVLVEPNAGVQRTLSVYTNAAWRSLSRRRPHADDTVGRRAKAFEPLGRPDRRRSA